MLSKNTNIMIYLDKKPLMYWAKKAGKFTKTLSVFSVFFLSDFGKA